MWEQAGASMIEAKRVKIVMRQALTAGLGAFLLAGAGALAAQDVPQQRSFEASAGDLRIIHLWSNDPDAFLTAWRGPTPPNLPTSTRMERNQPIQQFVLYANCTRDAAGTCNVTAKVLITAPDGTAYGDPLSFDIVKGPATAPPGNIGLAAGNIGLRVEDGEQLGRYRIELTATDHNSGLAATTLFTSKRLKPERCAS